MLAQNLSALLVARVLGFCIGRAQLKRRSAMKAEETALMQERKTAIGAEISQEIQRAAVADPNLPVTLDMISSTQTYAARAALIRNFVKPDPDRAALVEIGRASCRERVCMFV